MLLDPATEAVRKLARRGHDFDLPSLDKLFTRHVAAVGAVDETRAEANRLAKEINASAARGEDVTTRREHARSLKARIQELEENRRRLSAELEEFLLGIPNLPADDLPEGGSDEDAELVSTWGTRPVFDFQPKPTLMTEAPLGFQLHALSAWALFAFWPFSHLVHVFSMPLGYLTRPYIVYRSRDTQLGARQPRRGWERVR